MSTTMKLSIFFGLLAVNFSAHAGVTVGNGGDAVVCEESPASSYTGYYSFDYMMTLKEDNSDLPEFSDWAGYRQRILQLFAEKYPDLERLFLDFASRVPGEDLVPPDQIFLQERIWLEAIYGLVDLQDEQAIRKLPPNCYKSGEVENTLKVVQAVIRQPGENVIIYNYDPDVLRRLKSRPLQYSFLLVHEWLWDLVGDPEVVRRLNRFLHSKLAEDLNRDDFQKTLKNLGLEIHPRSFVPVCNRTPVVVEVITQTLRLSCEQIDEKLQSYPNFGNFNTAWEEYYFSSAVKSWNYVQVIEQYVRDRASGFASVGLTSLRAGDLTGLEGLFRLSFHGNGLDFLFQDLFYGFYDLKLLDFSYNSLAHFPARILEDTPNLKFLDLTANDLEEISFRNSTKISNHLTYLILNDNRLPSWPEDLANKAPNLFLLGMANNQMSRVPNEPLPKRLEWLDLSGNPFSELGPMKAISELRNLKYLDLSGIPLVDFKVDQLAPLCDVCKGRYEKNHNTGAYLGALFIRISKPSEEEYDEQEYLEFVETCPCIKAIDQSGDIWSLSITDAE